MVSPGWEHPGPIPLAVRLVATLLAMAVCAPRIYAQASGPFRLYPSAAGDSAVSTSLNLVVPADGSVPLVLESPTTSPETVDVVLSPFVDLRGEIARVRVALPGDPVAARTTRRAVTFDSALVPLVLDVGQLPSPDAFTGYVFVTRAQAVLESFKVVLRRPSTVSAAKLVLDRQAIELNYTRPLRGGGLGPAFTVQLWEESHDRQVEGVLVRLMELQTPSSSFDVRNNLRFSLNGVPSPDLWISPPPTDSEAQLRRIPPGGQITLQGTFVNLPVGEHRIKALVSAANSQPDPRQELALTLRVKASIWAAIVVLLVAIVFSYAATKGLNTRRQRIDFARRLADQRPGWLRGEPSILSVVWVRSILRQAQDLNRRRLLAGADVMDERLKQAAEVIKRLERLKDIRRSIKDLQQDRLVKRRAEKVLGSAEAGLGAGPLDERRSGDVDARLQQLGSWFVPGQLESGYWESLKADIDGLLASVHPGELADPQARKVVARLVRRLKAASPKDFNGKIEREKSYAALKLLWERHTDGFDTDFEDLVQSCLPSASLTELFGVADRASWRRLKTAAENKELRVVLPPHGSPDPPEAYEPLRFEVVPDDPKLADNYLFKHGLRYAWEITLHPKPSALLGMKRRAPPNMVLRPVTEEPRIVQYAPLPGEVSAIVTLKYASEEAKVEAAHGDKLDIAPSSTFQWLGAFTAVELAAVALAAIIALLTGLATFYADSATFGTLKDYISLFLWGVGADQTKNFFQTLQAYAGAGAGKSPSSA